MEGNTEGGAKEDISLSQPVIAPMFFDNMYEMIKEKITPILTKHVEKLLSPQSMSAELGGFCSYWGERYSEEKCPEQENEGMEGDNYTATSLMNAGQLFAAAGVATAGDALFDKEYCAVEI